MYRRFVLASLVAVGCGRESPPPSPSTSSPSPTTAPADPVPATAPNMVFAGDPCAKAKPHGTFKWIEDDYASAVACAKQQGKPLVIDLWAPWCHTCLSMQTTVFADKSFAADADKFVFVALDTDRDENAAAVAKYPMSAWPTFYVVSPDEAVLARFVGAASVAQFHAFLDAGARAHGGDAAGADAHLLAAERAIQAKDLEAADRELAAALTVAPKDWARRPDALVSLIGTRTKRRDYAGCLELAEKSLDQTGNAASATDFTYLAMSCAKERATDEAARVKKLRERAAARLAALVEDSAAPLSLDDRSDAMANLREILAALGKQAEARAVAEKQRALLDDAAAKAPSPIAAMTFNWPRAEVYVYLGRPLDLVPALEKSATDLPQEYDPRARLGWIYLKGGKLEEAAKWTDAALELVYGPRKARVLAQRAEIAAAAGDKAAERRYREQIVKTLEALPASQTTPDAIAKAKQAVVDLDQPAAAAK